MFKHIVLALTVTLLTACAGSGGIVNDQPKIVYNGEKYGPITITLSDNLSGMEDKANRVEQLDLIGKLQQALIAEDAYAENSENKIEVVIEKIRIRNGFNAVMFGFMSGTDNVGATVTLSTPKGDVKFKVKTNYALGGFGGGPTDVRLAWLGERLAEKTVQKITGKKKKSERDVLAL
jgi:hypothetical protein